MLLDPPSCPSWCTTHDHQRPPEWLTTPTAATRTCERRIPVEAGGERRHEIVLQRFSAIEYGELRCDAPIVRVDDGDALDLDIALILADSVRRLVEIADEPSIAA